MARVLVTMPQMGESITEGKIIRWAKKIGDHVARDEALLEISTDKVDSEIPSPQAGTVVEILHQVEATVAVGTAIAVIETDATAVKSAPTASAPAAVPPPPAPTPARAAALASAPAAVLPSIVATPTPAGQPPAPPLSGGPSGAPGPVPRTDGKRFFSPLVRALATEHGVGLAELSSVPGSGANERVTKRDFLAWLETRDDTLSSRDAEPLQTGTEALREQKPHEVGRIERVPMDRMRAAIAEHMVKSVHTSPHVYTLTEVDMHRVVAFRERFKRRFEETEGFRLTYTAFFADAVLRALRDFPGVNVSVEGQEILYKRFVNLGIAVAMGDKGKDGLIVPNVKNAETLNFLGLARAIDDLATRARGKKLKPDDASGGTFTITNMGMFGSTVGLPIINQPQTAILGVGAIKDRAWVVDGMLAVRPIMFLSLSYDHRVIDGALAAQFLEQTRWHLEHFDAATTGLEDRRAGDVGRS